MTLYLDCEFNGHNGSLLSMALVSDKDGSYFYEVVHCGHYIDPWVQQNVIPKLYKSAIDPNRFRALLCIYLNEHLGEDIVADWPHDFTLLMLSMTGDSYLQSNMIPCTMRLINSGQFTPDDPHNALSDAQALMKWCKENNV